MSDAVKDMMADVPAGLQKIRCTVFAVCGETGSQ